MGIYTINCPVCKQAHMWFSGNPDQTCFNCSNKETKTEDAEFLREENHKLLLVISRQMDEISALKAQLKEQKDLAEAYLKALQ